METSQPIEIPTQARIFLKPVARRRASSLSKEWDSDSYYNPISTASSSKLESIHSKSLESRSLENCSFRQSTEMISSPKKRLLRELEPLIVPTVTTRKRGRSFTNCKNTLNSLPSTPEFELDEDPMLSAVVEQDEFQSPFSKTPPKIIDIKPLIFKLLVLFISSTLFTTLLVISIPNLFLPRSVSSLFRIESILTAYRNTSFLAEIHIALVLFTVYLYQNCWSIPGAVLTNIIFGSIYSTFLGTVYACLGTAVGSTLAYHLGVLSRPIVEIYLPKPLQFLKQKLGLENGNGFHEDIFIHSLIIRLFPIIPYSVLNLVSGALEVPIPAFFLSTLFGSFPLNFTTVSIGEIIAVTAGSTTGDTGPQKIWTGEVVTKLIQISFVSLLPIIFKSNLIEIFHGARRIGMKSWLGVRSRFVVTLPSTRVEGVEGRKVLEELELNSKRREEKMKISGEWRRQFNPVVGLGLGKLVKTIPSPSAPSLESSGYFNKENSSGNSNYR